MRNLGSALCLTAALAIATIAPSLADEALDRLYAAAKTEGKVSMIGAPSAQVRKELSTAFTRRFPGIEFEYSGVSGNALVSKLSAEARGGVHSIDLMMIGSTPVFATLKPEGHLQPFDSWIVSQDAKNPSKWVDGRLGWADDDKTGLAMMDLVSPFVVVNSQLVREGELRKDADLLDPKWKGRIASNSPEVPGNAALHYRRLFELHGADFLRRLKTQDVAVTTDLRQLVDWVAKGRYAIGLGFSPSATAYFINQGVTTLRMTENMQWQDKMFVTPGYAALSVPKVVPHPNAAKLLVNWLLTKEGQDALVKGLQYPSRRLDADQSPVDAFLRRAPGGQYYEAYTESYFRSPAQAEARELVKQIGFGR